jgi:pyruvate/2-oxoglutarate/acetoin dehydrogenase E1 component
MLVKRRQIFVPRSLIQAKGPLLASILDPNPTTFMESGNFYRSGIERILIVNFELPVCRTEVLDSW